MAEVASHVNKNCASRADMHSSQKLIGVTRFLHSPYPTLLTFVRNSRTTMASDEVHYDIIFAGGVSFHARILLFFNVGYRRVLCLHHREQAGQG